MNSATYRRPFGREQAPTLIWARWATGQVHHAARSSCRWSCSRRWARSCGAWCRRDLGELHQRSHKYGVKVWFDTEKPTREHYEAQVIGKRYVPEASILAIELGFHAENTKVADNDATIAGLLKREASGARPSARRPRSASSSAVTPGAASPRRGPTPTSSDPELVLELGTRLTDYICAIEPLRR